MSNDTFDRFKASALYNDWTNHTHGEGYLSKVKRRSKELSKRASKRMGRDHHHDSGSREESRTLEDAYKQSNNQSHESFEYSSRNGSRNQTRDSVGDLTMLKNAELEEGMENEADLGGKWYDEKK